MRIDETQDQYNECFTEVKPKLFVLIRNYFLINIFFLSIVNLYFFISAKATNQDMLLDLQRDAIESLHKRIHCVEYNKRLIAITLHAIYYSILSEIQVYATIYALFFNNLYFYDSRNNKRSRVFSIKKCACRISVMFSKIVVNE